nr:MAG TPA: hypothetical protein [Caudoviricetes sp.]
MGQFNIISYILPTFHRQYRFHTTLCFKYLSDIFTCIFR